MQSLSLKLKPFRDASFRPKLLVTTAILLFSTLSVMPLNASASPASWALHTFPSVRNSGSAASINAVSCSSNISCAAGGFTTDSNGDVQALVSTFDGHNWTDQQVATSLNGGGHAQVSAISCPSNSLCVAGGYFSRPNNTTGAFVSLYNGQTWNDQEVGNTLGGIGAAQLMAVSCASNTLCVAGGFYIDNSFNSQAFVSVYNGQTWTDHEIASSLNPGGDALVSSISCPTFSSPSRQCGQRHHSPSRGCSLLPKGRSS